MKYKIFIVLFLLLCIIPSAGMLLFPEATVMANETLSAKPELFYADGKMNTQILEQVTAYVADHFAFRAQMVTAGSLLQTKLLATSPVEDVVYGRDSWLYFKKTLEDYRNAPTLSHDEAAQIADVIAQLQEYCETQGANFLLTIAPNKNSLYSEHMPARYLQQEADGNYEILLPYLINRNINYLDLFYFFNGQEKVYYYKTDSHWTNEGAALVHQLIMESLALPYTNFATMTYEAEYTHTGDLYEMLYPTGLLREETQVYPTTFSYVSEPRTAEDILIETRSEAGQGRLIFCRDSFGNALYPFLAEDFAEAVITRQTPYPIEDVKQGDTVIIEIVERNLPNLLRYYKA